MMWWPFTPETGQVIYAAATIITGFAVVWRYIVTEHRKQRARLQAWADTQQLPAVSWPYAITWDTIDLDFHDRFCKEVTACRR